MKIALLLMMSAPFLFSSVARAQKAEGTSLNATIRDLETKILAKVPDGIQEELRPKAVLSQVYHAGVTCGSISAKELKQILEGLLESTHHGAPPVSNLQLGIKLVMQLKNLRQNEWEKSAEEFCCSSDCYIFAPEVVEAYCNRHQPASAARK